MGRFGVDSKKADAVLKKCDEYMANIKKLIGTTSGAGKTGKSGNLIGAVEYLGTQACDGKELTEAYNNFNNTVLKDIRKKMSAIDTYLEYMDKIAK